MASIFEHPIVERDFDDEYNSLLEAIKTNRRLRRNLNIKDLEEEEPGIRNEIRDILKDKTIEDAPIYVPTLEDMRPDLFPATAKKKRVT